VTQHVALSGPWPVPNRLLWAFVCHVHHAVVGTSAVLGIVSREAKLSAIVVYLRGVSGGTHRYREDAGRMCPNLHQTQLTSDRSGAQTQLSGKCWRIIGTLYTTRILSRVPDVFVLAANSLGHD
jgi:hypothetical protein